MEAEIAAPLRIGCSDIGTQTSTHPLAARDTVSVEEPSRYAIGHLDVALPPELFEELTVTHAVGSEDPPSTAPDTQPSELVLAIAEGGIVQPVVSVFSDGYSHPDVVYRPIHDMPVSRSVLAWRRGSRQPNLCAFVDAIHAEVRR